MYVFPVFPCIAQQLKDLCKMFTQQCQNNAVAETETPSPVNACALEPKQFTHTHQKNCCGLAAFFYNFVMVPSSAWTMFVFAWA